MILILLQLALFSLSSLALEQSKVIFLPEELAKIPPEALSKPNKDNVGSFPKIRIELIENVDREKAKLRFQQKSSFFAGLYGNSNSPYQGAISRTLRCSNKEAIPKKNFRSNKNEEIVGYAFYTNDYLSIGVCEKEDQKYLAHVLQIYCIQKKMFAEIHFFDRLNSTIATKLKDIKCL